MTVVVLENVVETVTVDSTSNPASDVTEFSSRLLADSTLSLTKEAFDVDRTRASLLLVVLMLVGVGVGEAMSLPLPVSSSTSMSMLMSMSTSTRPTSASSFRWLPLISSDMTESAVSMISKSSAASASCSSSRRTTTSFSSCAGIMLTPLNRGVVGTPTELKQTDSAATPLPPLAKYAACLDFWLASCFFTRVLGANGSNDSSRCLNAMKIWGGAPLVKSPLALSPFPLLKFASLFRTDLSITV